MQKDDDKIKKDMFYTRCKVFFEKKMPVHISTSRNDLRYWYNGIISEMSADFIILKENKLGELPIFFMEMYDVEKLAENKCYNQERNLRIGGS